MDKLQPQWKLYREVINSQFFYHPVRKEFRFIEVNPRQAAMDEDIFRDVFQVSQMILSIDLMVQGNLDYERSADHVIRLQ